MKDKQIILIGNGRSVLDNSYGEIIDSYDTVVRFNNFQLDGYEEYVGRKCDILARRACDDVNLVPADMFNKFIFFVTYCRHTSGMQAVARNIGMGHYGKKCIVVHDSYCRSIGNKIGLDQPIMESASVGALAVGYFLSHFNLITLYGFDFLQKNKQGHAEHYFPKTPRDDRFHNGDKEKTYILDLEQKGRIEFLTKAIGTVNGV